MSLSRAVIDALLPPGSLWVPEDGGGLDALLDGMAGNMEEVRVALSQLAYLRDPQRTPILSDLEREYGIMPDNTQSDAIRRQRLSVAKSAVRSDGSLGFMENALQAAGFDVQVHANQPAIDPGLFLRYVPSSIIGNVDAVLGNAFLGAKGGGLLVNGSGQYYVPVDSWYWPLVFFVGGDVTRDGSGAITAIAEADVLASRREELKRLILKLKPMHSWAGLMIRYIGG